MAVASLAAILKPQILSLMQGGKEEGREKREKELSLNQSGLLDTVSRHAAAMAQIKSWQYKRLQNKEAEKKDFFSLSAPLFFLSPLHLPLPFHHLNWLNILHKVQREDSFFSFFSLLELCLKKCKFNS